MQTDRAHSVQVLKEAELTYTSTEAWFQCTRQVAKLVMQLLPSSTLVTNSAFLSIMETWSVMAISGMPKF